jgi:methyl-accepting chemotaxis protein
VLHSISLSTRLNLINLLVAILAFGGLAANYFTQQTHTRITELAQTLGKAGRIQALADMNHDGLKGTLYRVLHAASFNKDGLTAASDDMEQQAAALKERLSDLKKLELPAHILDAVKTSDKPFQNYVQVGTQVASLAKNGQIEKANQSLAEFETAFTALEVLQNKIGDVIEAETASLATQSRDLALLTNRVSISVAVAFLFLFAGLFISVRNRVTQPLTIISGLIQRIAAGEAHVKIDGNGRKDEIGMVFDALIGFQVQTQKAQALQDRTD